MVDKEKKSEEQKKGDAKKGCLGCLGFIVIIIIIAAIIGAFNSGNSDTPEKKAPTVKHEKKLSTKDKIKAALQANDTFDKTNDFNKKSSVIDFKYNEDNGFVFARVYGHDSFSVKKTMWMDTRYLLKRIKNIKEVKEIAINIAFPMEDAYGKKSYDTVMKVTFKRATIDKIDFDNFLYSNIPTIADEYWQHPNLK